MERPIEERLRRAGYRVTRQRTAVYEYLISTKSHPTVEQVHDAVRERFPHISLATVYNAVDSLVDVGLVRRINRAASSARYDGDVGDHAHFRCVVCDQLRDVSMHTNPSADDGLDGCEIISTNVEFFGYCPRCRRDRLGLPPLPENNDRRAL
ncbi:transcriptional repressor [Candidatus Poribacteria bacterium]|nr:transcriptional repressor [Candidatus Poribacteria bacterium]